MAAADGAFGYKLKNEMKELIGTCGKAAKGGGGARRNCHLKKPCTTENYLCIAYIMCHI